MELFLRSSRPLLNVEQKVLKEVSSQYVLPSFLMNRTFLGWSTRSFVFGVDFCLTLFSRIIFMFKDLTKIVTEFGNSLTYLLESQTRVDLCKKYGGPNLVTQYIICYK